MVVIACGGWVIVSVEVDCLVLLPFSWREFRFFIDGGTFLELRSLSSNQILKSEFRFLGVKSLDSKFTDSDQIRKSEYVTV
jgi:hypothetical protein